MKGPCLLGIDVGLSGTKALVCDENGGELGMGESRGSYGFPRPGWVERDAREIWEGCLEAVRIAIKNAGIPGRDIVAVGVAGHGDGLYLVDARGEPVRPAILSLDGRAREILGRWEASGVSERALPLTGQRPFAASPATLLSWVQEHEPAHLEESRWALFCKDWIKLKLTGEASTDPTEASASFTDVATQGYSEAAFELYGLEEVRGKLPPVVGCAEVAGTVTREAAGATGLLAGTPVVSGLHDVDASALGVGSVLPGGLCIVSGTWSVNGVVSTRPAVDPRWQCRNFVEPGLWMNMATSPAATANLEWFIRQLCPAEVEAAGREGRSPFEFANEEVRAVISEESEALYAPFLYGTLQDASATAGFFGLRGWHTRGHLLRALFEGVVFNHKTHVDALRDVFPVSEVRLTGGGTRSGLWRQMFADVLGVEVGVANTEESGAKGAAPSAPASGRASTAPWGRPWTRWSASTTRTGRTPVTTPASPAPTRPTPPSSKPWRPSGPNPDKPGVPAHRGPEVPRGGASGILSGGWAPQNG